MALSNIVRKQISSTKVEDIVTFTQSVSGLNQQLYPVQRFILKILEKMPLDNTVKDIPINNKFNTEREYLFTEREYYEYLREQNRISCSYEDYCNSEQTTFQLVMGRRGTKTTVIAIYVCYKLYQLLLNPHPQLMFNILENSPMNVTMVALGQDNADKLFGKFYKLICDSKFFRPFLLEPATGNSLRIWTHHDIERLAGQKPTAHSNSITISASPNTPGVRGDDNIFCIMDEFAHYNISPNSTRDQPLDEFIYNALVPSTSAFTLKGTTKMWGKTFIFSSPNGKRGRFYQDYLNAFEYGAESASLCMQAPTWETNPNLASAILKAEFKLRPSTYSVEYGAEFGETAGAWIEDRQILYQAVVKDKDPLSMEADLYTKYFLGADFGFGNDGTTYSVCHVEPEYRPDWHNFIKDLLALNDPLRQDIHRLEVLEQKVEEGLTPLPELEAEAKSITDNIPLLRPQGETYIVDYTRVQFPNKGEWEGYTLLPFNEMLDWLESLFIHYPIVLGITDQWASALTQQLINERSFSSRFKAVNHSSAINDSQYKLFQLLLFENKVKLPDDPDMLKEMERLRVKQLNKTQIKVEAPPGKQNHDDQFDSIIRSLWLAHAYYHDPKSLEDIGFKVAPNVFLPQTSASSNPYLKARMNARHYVNSVRVGGRSSYIR